MASDPKVFYDREQDVWVMFYFGVGAGTGTVQHNPNHIQSASILDRNWINPDDKRFIKINVRGAVQPAMRISSSRSRKT